MSSTTKTPVMVLQEFAMKQCLSPPEYQIVFQKSGTHVNRFDFVVNVAGIQASGSGSSKQIGKHQAAHNALMKLKEMGRYNPAENPVAEFKVPLTDESSPCKSALNCIVDLQNLCLENKLPPPLFHEISSVGPPHAKEFAYECKLSSVTTEAKANTKKMARQLAAKLMLQRIKDIIPNLLIEENVVCKKLTDKDNEAIIKYMDLHDEVIPDKSVKIEEIPNTLAKLMKAHNLTYEDFREALMETSEKSLKDILNRLDVTYEIIEFNESPPVAALKIKIDTPFVTMGRGVRYEEAVRKALRDAFEMMNLFMQIEV